MIILAKAQRGQTGHLRAHSNSMIVKWQSIIEEDKPDKHFRARASTISIMTCPGGRKGTGKRGVLVISK